MRHALGVLGVLAAGVLLAVSAAMNWRFGMTLGKTEFDGLLYASASAAADCFKALVPFFFFAALRNKMWAQAAAAAVLAVVVTAYSLTSALGHAMLNRDFTAQARVLDGQIHTDLRADLERAKQQLAWVPQHRPADAVRAELEGLQSQRQWQWSNGCSDIKGKTARDFCGQVSSAKTELASAEQAEKLEARIADVQAKLSTKKEGASHGAADPQAAVLTQLANTVVGGVKVEDVQMALTVFVALLLEVGSGFGMYVAFSTWRINDRKPAPAPSMASLARVVPATQAAVVAAPVVAPAAAKPRLGANDNKTAPAQPKLVAPESDVERFKKERIEAQDGASITATALYEDYCAWCEEQDKEPLALPTFGREFGDLGVQKAKIAGRVRYIGIALKSGAEIEEDKKPLIFGTQAA